MFDFFLSMDLRFVDSTLGLLLFGREKKRMCGAHHPSLAP